MTANVLKCKFTIPSGRQCRANAMSGSRFCFFHDPDMSVKRTQAQRTGGRRNQVAVLSAEAPEVTLNTVSDVVSLLANTINHARTGKLDPKIANCVGYLSGVLLRALEADALEERISALETAVRNPSATSQHFHNSGYCFVPEYTDGAQ